MNLFRSEEHARNWHGYSDESAAGLLALPDIWTIFSSSLFRDRGGEDYISGYRERALELVQTAREVTHDDPFWRRVPK